MEFIKVTEQKEPMVALIELNRPKELNALNPQLMGELRDALQALDKNDQVRVIILTGNEQAFAAGADIIVFMDGDGSDCPEFLEALVTPILRNKYDFVIGSRIRGEREPGSLTFQQVFAGRLAGWMLQAWYGVKFTDMSPFRAIRRSVLEPLPLREETYGWNLEMQMLVAQAKVRILEIPVNHRRRQGGVSKVSGTVRGTLLAGVRIASTFLRVAFTAKSAR